MRQQRTTRHSCNYAAPNVHSGQLDYKSLSQLELEHIRAANFEAGSLLAATALCIMFLILSLGVVVFGW